MGKYRLTRLGFLLAVEVVVIYLEVENAFGEDGAAVILPKTTINQHHPYHPAQINSKTTPNKTQQKPKKNLPGGFLRLAPA